MLTGTNDWRINPAKVYALDLFQLPWPLFVVTFCNFKDSSLLQGLVFLEDCPSSPRVDKSWMIGKNEPVLILTFQVESSPRMGDCVAPVGA